MLFHASHKRSRRLRSTLIVVAALACAGCGKGEPGQNDSAVAPADTAQEPADVAANPDAAADVAVEVHEKTVWERLGELEIAGMTRVRSQVQSDYATLSFATATPNPKGNTAQIEVTIGACPGCKPSTKAEVEGRKDQQLAQLGELHAKSPGLVWAVDELELMPLRSAVATYARSFVDDGQTRAAVHTLEVSYVGDDISMRLFAYPRSGFPQSDVELAESFSKDELTQAVTAVFKAAVQVIWPQ